MRGAGREEIRRARAARAEALRAALEQERRWLAADLWEGMVAPRCRVCGARREEAVIRRCAWCGAKKGEQGEKEENDERSAEAAHAQSGTLDGAGRAQRAASAAPGESAGRAGIPAGTGKAEARGDGGFDADGIAHRPDARERTVLRYYYAQGLSDAEIAEKMGLTDEWARKKRYAALRRLERAEAGESGEGPPAEKGGEKPDGRDGD